MEILVGLTWTARLVYGNVHSSHFYRKLQMEKEKQHYDFDNIQSQLDKALGQATRLQKERENVQLETDRLRDKYEKAQVLDN